MGTRRRLAAGVLAGTIVLAIVPGFAVSLGGLGSTGLGTGDDVVAGCDTNGFSVSYTTSGGAVTHVTVGGIADPGCEGGRLSLTLADTTGAAVGSAGPQTVPTDGDTADNSMTVALSPQPAASVVTAVQAVVVGP